MTTVEVDASGMKMLIDDLAVAMGKAGQPGDIAEITKDEGRRLVVEMVKDTPPKTREDGQQTIRRDMNSLFTGVSPGLIRTVKNSVVGTQLVGRRRRKIKAGTLDVDTWITTKDGKKHLLWDEINEKGDQLREYHLKHLNKRGRAPRALRPGSPEEWRARMVVPLAKKRRYERQILKRVGRMKASLAVAAHALGVANITNWISRHFIGKSAPYSVINLSAMNDPIRPVIVFGSRARGIMRFAQIYSYAVRARMQAVKKRIRLLVSGYNRDLARQMRVQSREKRSGQGGRYAIG